MPEPFTTREAMAIGTAGYTAMLCVLALERYGALKPTTAKCSSPARPAASASSRWRCSRSSAERVIAATGKTAEADYLKALGASGIIDRAELSAPGKPLQKERWGAVVDAVGSHTLANACAQTRYGGAVAACGLAQGSDLPATVMPFILRAWRCWASKA